MSTSRFVPIAELPNAKNFDPENPAHNISWDFRLPPSIDDGRLLLDTKKLNLIHRVAAFSSTHVEEDFKGPTSNDKSSLVLYSDGTAALAKATTRDETSMTILLDDGPSFFTMMDYFTTRPVHFLNKTAIASNVVDRLRENNNITREEAWVYTLDEALRGSVNDAAKLHLTQRETPLMHNIDTGILSFYGLLLTKDILMQNPTGLGLDFMLLSTIYLFQITASAIVNNRYYGKTLLSERRWSLNPMSHAQPDRYLATVALNSVSPLIRYKK